MIDIYIEKYGRRLFGLCRALIGADAEDLYQETWLRAITKLDSYDKDRPFEAWITGICVNAYRDEVRKRKRRRIYEIDAESEDKELIFENETAPDDYSVSDIRDAVDRLPKKLREAVILYYYNDLDEAATAEALGVPKGTVKSRLSAARKILKGVLTE